MLSSLALHSQHFASCSKPNPTNLSCVGKLSLMASQSMKECLGTKPFDHISLCQGTFRPLDHIQHTRCGEGSPRIPLPGYRIFPTWIGSSINWCLFSYLLPEALHIMNRPVPSSILNYFTVGLNVRLERDLPSF